MHHSEHRPENGGESHGDVRGNARVEPRLELRDEVRWVIEAAQEKKAEHITVLDLRGMGAFSDYFVICSGASHPQLQAIRDSVTERLNKEQVRIRHYEGRQGSEWVLLDYGSFVVHIFSERARLYYDLERLWRAAGRIDVSEKEPRDGRPAQDAVSGDESRADL
jgi:ribosome-associated protein